MEKEYFMIGLGEWRHTDGSRYGEGEHCRGKILIEPLL